MRILEVYEAGSGQKLNLQKTSILFNRNTSAAKQQEILSLSGFSESQRIDTYLGLPSFIGRSKVQAFNGIKDRVQQRLNNWKVKFLSQAGMEILLKAVVQAIPTYSMSVFLIPATLCRELQGMMQHFWWGHMAKESNVHWMCWEKMGRSKMEGGLGFRELTIFNKALLAKQGWRIIQEPNSLVSQVLKAKYFPHGSFLISEVGTRPSFVWRSLLSAKELLIEGLVWRIGDGKSIKIWQDRWLPTPISYSVQSPPRLVPDDSTVAMLIDSEMCGWKEDLITEIFSPEEARVVASIPLCPTLPPDRLVWRVTKSGVFSVRSAYHMGMEIKKRKNGCTSKAEDRHNVWSTLWSLGVPNTMKIFLWRACNDLLPTKCNLFRRNIVKDNNCPCCLRERESGLHALWTCPAAQDVWGGGLVIFQKCAFLGDTFMQLVEFCLDRLNTEELSLMAVISRRIWLRRNKFVF
jgi:hypothetical protein